jgi:hypothetical protein
MLAPYTHRQQVAAVADVLEAAYHTAESFERPAREAAAQGEFLLTDDLWESAHRLLWARLWARIEAARLQEG